METNIIIRHDTESEGGEASDEEDQEEDKDTRKMKRDMRAALGIKEENKTQKESKMNEEDDEDIEVVRKTDIGTTNEPERKIQGGLKTVQELKAEVKKNFREYI